MIRLGLRKKFFLYSNTLILVTMTLVTFLAVEHERKSRYEAIARRGLSVTEVLSIAVTDALLYQELGLVTEEGLIDNYLEEVRERNRDLVRYVAVADTAGIVTHSSRWDLLGKRFDRALTRDAIGKPAPSEIRILESGEGVLEVRMPLNISSRFWGSLAIGFSLAPIDQEVRAIARQAALVAVILMLGNSLLTAVYVESLIRPILDLNRTMKRAGVGDLAVRARGGRSDEVRELGEAFNRMMEELQQARGKEQAQQAQLAHTEKMAAVGTLAAGVAHEVNNPLAGILTCLEVLQANPDDGEARERYLALVEDGIRRIEHTVMNLLDFSRPRGIEARPTSLNERLRQVAELASYQARRNHVEIALELSREEPVVLADRFQMEQLFLNLVLNAIQAMPDGGSLTLRTSRTENRVVAEVKDTGIGIRREIRDRVFDPFFTTRGVGQGTGLGLSVSYGIVTAHGGTIDFESEPGKGSVFRVGLPVVTETTREVVA
jgi:two-component system NtrC family sensor kinase